MCRFVNEKQSFRSSGTRNCFLYSKPWGHITWIKALYIQSLPLCVCIGSSSRLWTGSFFEVKLNHNIISTSRFISVEGSSVTRRRCFDSECFLLITRASRRSHTMISEESDYRNKPVRLQRIQPHIHRWSLCLEPDGRRRWCRSRVCRWNRGFAQGSQLKRKTIIQTIMRINIKPHQKLQYDHTPSFIHENWPVKEATKYYFLFNPVSFNCRSDFHQEAHLGL